MTDPACDFYCGTILQGVLAVPGFGAARVYTNLGEYQSAKHLHWHIGAGRQLRPY